MNRKGFTLVELLAAIVIIAVLGGMAVIAYQTFFANAEDKYYQTVESNILLAGSDYFEDHREKIPTGSNYGEVSLLELMSSRYIDQIVDANGNPCNDGSVYAYREKNKLEYEVCLNNCGNHISYGKYCTDEKPNSRIEISSETVSGNEYDVLKSYYTQEYSMGEDINVSFNLSDAYTVSNYLVTNTNNNTQIECHTVTGNYCSTEITETGTYKVVAYDGYDIISTRYFNAKIAKGTPSFTLNNKDKYLIDMNSCYNNINTKKVQFNIVKQTNDEYKSIMYQVKRYSENESPTLSDWKEPRGLLIEEVLESGHYEIQVVVQNYSGEGQDEQAVTIEFDVTYLLDLKYEDGSPSGTHEVVKDQNYNYLSDNDKGEPLPETKESSGSNVDIKWYKNNSRVYPSVNIVADSCTYTLIGKTAISVPAENIDSSHYCNNENRLKYTGSEITLTREAPSHVTFINNVATTVGPHTIRVRVDFPSYIWSDGTTADKEFTCTIVKGDNPIEITDNQEWATTFSSSPKDHSFIGARNAIGSVTYSIVSQYSGSRFSIPNETASTIRMLANAPSGSYDVVVRASASGNANYNSGYKDISMNIVVGVEANPMTVTTPQNWQTSFSSNSQTKVLIPASNAKGDVKYEIASQKNVLDEEVNYFFIPTNTNPNVVMGENTPAGSYKLEVNAIATGNGEYANKTSKMTVDVVVLAQECNAPTDVSISKTGIVTWTSSSNCPDATYQLKVEDGTYTNATSGVDKLADITAAAGTRTIYVKAIAPNSNYSDSQDGLGSIAVYSVTLTKGTGISTVSGAGNYITGTKVTLGATMKSGYKWVKWTKTSGGSSVSTTKAYSSTITSNWNYKANGKKITYTKTRYACIEGKWRVYLSGIESKTCTEQTIDYANKHNKNNYRICNQGCSPEGCIYIVWEYTRYGCKNYSDKVYDKETGLTSCTESNGKNYQVKCTEE